LRLFCCISEWLDAPEFVPKNKVDTDMSGYFAHGGDINRAEFNRFLHDLNSPTNSFALNGHQEQYFVEPAMSYGLFMRFDRRNFMFSGNPTFMPVEHQQLSRPFVPACFPFPSILVPNGYSANFATINGKFFNW
jgi:hypothetical protein